MNDNYQDIKDYIKSTSLRKSIKYLKNSSAIIELTKFLPDTASVNERIFCVIEDILDVQLCEFCQKNPVKFLNHQKGYRRFCSKKCSAQSPVTKKKHKTTCIDKYGEITNLKTNYTKDKIKKTNLKRYGFDHAMKSTEVKEKTKQTLRKDIMLMQYRR